MDRTAQSSGLRWEGDWRTTVFAAIFTPLLAGLGLWQLERAAEKDEIGQTWEARRSAAAVPVAELPTNPTALVFRRVTLSGSFLSGRDFLLDNRIYRGQYGVEVISPFRGEDGRLVLINRGWLAADPARRALPEIPPPGERLELRATVYIPPGEPYVLGEPASGAEWPRRVQVADPKILGDLLGESVFDHILRLEADSPGALDIDWQLINTQPEKHRAYAVQWFVMATALLLLFFWRSTNIGGLLRRRPGVNENE
jgi:cytochrome oxidase assembly protein ShyY1